MARFFTRGRVEPLPPIRSFADAQGVRYERRDDSVVEAVRRARENAFHNVAEVTVCQ